MIFVNIGSEKHLPHFISSVGPEDVVWHKNYVLQEIETKISKTPRTISLSLPFGIVQPYLGPLDKGVRYILPIEWICTSPPIVS
jgi:hypothetical protein